MIIKVIFEKGSEPKEINPGIRVLSASMCVHFS